MSSRVYSGWLEKKKESLQSNLLLMQILITTDYEYYEYYEYYYDLFEYYKYYYDL